MKQKADSLRRQRKLKVKLQQDSSRKKGKDSINKIRNEGGEIIETQGIVKSNYKQLYANQMDNMEVMDKLAERYKLTNLNQENIENMNTPIRSNEIKTVIKNLSIKKNRSRWLHR